MQRLLNQLWFLFVLPMTLGVVLFLAANTETGRGLIVRGIEQASGGQVKLSGLGGVLPLAPRLAHLELRETRTALGSRSTTRRSLWMVDNYCAGRLRSTPCLPAPWC